MKKAPKKGLDSWQIVYIDLMTNIMIFFVILWSISQGKDQGISPTLGDESRRMVNLPGDVLFQSGNNKLSDDGRGILKKLFLDEKGEVLSFQSSGLVKRLLMVHGHTDGDGDKDRNLRLGIDRAFAAYGEIKKYSKDLPDHVILCTHADNQPENEIPKFEGKLTDAQKSVLRDAKAKNRRITIEDKTVDSFKGQL